MKKSTLIIVILLLIAVIVVLLQFNPVTKEVNNQEVLINKQQIIKEQEEILKLRNEIEEQLRKKQEIKAKQERLIKLQNPDFALSELNQIENMHIDVLEGDEVYENTQNEDTFWFKKGAKVNLKYHFIIGADLQLDKWEVDTASEDLIIFTRPFIKPYIKSLTELEDESYIQDINENKKLFVKRYKTSDIEFIRDFAQKATINKINNDSEIWDNANEGLYKNLDSIKELIMQLGYKKVLIIPQ